MCESLSCYGWVLENACMLVKKTLLHFRLQYSAPNAAVGVVFSVIEVVLILLTILYYTHYKAVCTIHPHLIPYCQWGRWPDDEYHLTKHQNNVKYEKSISHLEKILINERKKILIKVISVCGFLYIRVLLWVCTFFKIDEKIERIFSIFR